MKSKEPNQKRAKFKEANFVTNTGDSPTENSSNSDSSISTHTPNPIDGQDPLIELTRDDSFNQMYDGFTLSQSQSQSFSQVTCTQIFGEAEPPPVLISPKRKAAPSKAIQKSIFDFAQPVEKPTLHSDPFYATIQEIYRFFNREKSIPAILTEIHKAGGNVNQAVLKLSKKRNTNDPVDFGFKTVKAPPDKLERYFNVQ